MLTRAWPLFLGAVIGVVSGGAACSSRGADPGAARQGSGSDPAAASGSASASGSAAASGSATASGSAAPPPADGAGAPAPPGSAGDAASPAAPGGAGELRALSDDEIRTLVTPRLRAGETLAHKPFRGPLGPKPDHVLVVVDRGGSAAGFVLVPGGKPERIELPSLSQGSLEGVPAVLFLDVDGQPGKEAIIMTRQMTGAGPQGAIPRAFNQVIAWNGSAFVRLSDVEEALLDLETAAEIRKALAARAKEPK